MTLTLQCGTVLSRDTNSITCHTMGPDMWTTKKITKKQLQIDTSHAINAINIFFVLKMT